MLQGSNLHRNHDIRIRTVKDEAAEWQHSRNFAKTRPSGIGPNSVVGYSCFVQRRIPILESITCRGLCVAGSGCLCSNFLNDVPVFDVTDECVFVQTFVSRALPALKAGSVEHHVRAFTAEFVEDTRNWECSIARAD